MKKLAFTLALLSGAAAFAADVDVDFAKITGKINPKLHSSGWGPRIYPRAIENDDAKISALGMYASRTHDWALINPGQRLCDTHHIFPVDLDHLDPKDPRNYFFGPTDYSLTLTKNIGHKIFYRLGTSIEHTTDRHFNALAPKSYERYAEILAGIMRHYLKGWANGFEWSDDFDGWEIWNEPDGITNCWVLRDCNEPDWKKKCEIHRDEFIKFFVTVLKRLKSEFPDQQIGGPALCWADLDYIGRLLDACQAEGIAPDFISWHGYTQDPVDCVARFTKVRELLDTKGFPKTRMIFNEWHYIRTWDGIHGRNSTVAAIKRAHEGPTGHLNIDSAAMNVSMLCRFQDSPMDEAFYYGCAVSGNWGYQNQMRQLNKCWYSMKLFGDFVKNADDKVAFSVATNLPTVTACAAWAKDKRSASIVVVDYRGKKGKLNIGVKGLDGVQRLTAQILDHTRDLAPLPVTWDGNGFTLTREDENSAAFLVTLEL